MAELKYTKDGRLLFTKEMRKEYKILVPNMLPVHFKLFEKVLQKAGYDIEVLTNSSHRVVEEGLKYVHNDTCYPALLVIGQMIDALNTFIQQCAFAEFESMAHALPPEELNAQKLNELALKSAKDFGMCPDGLEIYYQYYWMDITHFFEYPFYVISYPVSLDIAMQLYDLELEEEGKGLAKYFEILPRDYDTFLETVENGGLTSPFTEGGIRSVAAAIAETIGYDRPIADAA